jgi:CubicO group peptidase (beta-lactamase class C family)
MSLTRFNDVASARIAGVVSGSVEPGFGAVADAFAENLLFRGDTAASCAAYVDGRLVVDLWAGETEAGPWSPDLRNVVFSVSKGVTAVSLLMAVEAGHLALDAPVTIWWPEYGAHGKEDTTLRQVLAHQAGLVAPQAAFTADALRRWHPVVEALAAQAPDWAPGTAHRYHPLTVGWLAGEVLRRATDCRPSQWLDERINARLGTAMSYGADPLSSTLRTLEAPLPITDAAEAELVAEALSSPLDARSMSLGGLFDPLDMAGSANGRVWLDSEIPAANLVASARDLAKLYAATVGEIDGVRLLSEQTVRDARRVQSSGQPWQAEDSGSRWGTGFMLDNPLRQMAGPGSFGHDGFGGQVAFGHLEHQLGFAYQTVTPGGIPDDRAEALCRALRSCL